MNNNTHEHQPARFRLMQQEDFVRKFYKNVISHFNVYESAVARNDYELAERLQIVLRGELANAIDAINGNGEAWGMKNEFTKVGYQSREQQQLLVE